MNKVTKGALATAAGVALLLGGGGTLALWSDEKKTGAGTIVAGDLGLTANAGVWRSNKSAALDGVIENISLYNIVPGETLTYTQDLTLTLVGDAMTANLIATGAGAASLGTDPFTAENIDVQTTYTTIVGGTATATALPLSLTEDNHGDVVTATTSFTFDANKTIDLEDTGATYNFDTVGYVLQQVAP